MSIRKGKNHILRSGLFFLFSSSDNKVDSRSSELTHLYLHLEAEDKLKGVQTVSRHGAVSSAPGGSFPGATLAAAQVRTGPLSHSSPSDQLLEAQTLPETVYINTAHQKAQPHPPCSDAKLCPHRLSRFWGDFLCAQDYSCLGSFAENQL